MNDIHRVSITPSNIVADVTFRYDDARRDALMSYVRSTESECSICHEKLCKMHIVEYIVPFYYIYKHFLLHVKKYLDVRRLIVSYTQDDEVCLIPCLEKRGGVKIVYSVGADRGEDKISPIVRIKTDGTVNEISWEQLRQFLINSPKYEDRYVGENYFTNRILITPQKLRVSKQKKHFETDLLLEIISSGDRVTVSQIHKLAKTGVVDPETQTTLQMVTTKHGILRSALFSKYPSNNGRVVVVPGKIPFGVIELPMKFRELLQEDLYEPGMDVRCVNLDGVYKAYDHSFIIPRGTLVKRCLRDGDPVIVNRQPTLHWLSMLVHRVKFTDTNAIGLHPCVTSAYNADFDGDEMNIHPYPSIRSAIEGSVIMNSRDSFACHKRLYIGLIFHEITTVYLHSHEIDFFPKTFYYRHGDVLICGGRVRKGKLSKETIGISQNSAFYHMQYYGPQIMCKFIDDSMEFCKSKMLGKTMSYSKEFLHDMIVSGGRGNLSNEKMIYDTVNLELTNSSNTPLNMGPTTTKFMTSSLESVTSSYNGGLSVEECVGMSVPVRNSLIIAKMRISETGALVNRLSIILSSLVLDENLNIIYDEKIVGRVMFSYKYYSDDYDAYVDLRQLLYDNVVVPRLGVENLCDEIEDSFKNAGVALPEKAPKPETIRKAPTNFTTLENSFEYNPTQCVKINTQSYDTINDRFVS